MDNQLAFIPKSINGEKYSQEHILWLLDDAADKYSGAWDYKDSLILTDVNGNRYVFWVYEYLLPYELRAKQKKIKTYAKLQAEIKRLEDKSVKNEMTNLWKTKRKKGYNGGDFNAGSSEYLKLEIRKRKKLYSMHRLCKNCIYECKEYLPQNVKFSCKKRKIKV